MRKYSISLIASILLLLICVALFNWLIDPYEVFGSPDIKGLNKYKVEANRHTRLGKVYQVERVKPEVIFLASSRGLVVPENYFSNASEVALNLSLASGSMYELFRYFQHAQAVKPLKRVVLALDEQFTNQVQSEFSEGRLKVDINGKVNTSKGDKVLGDMVNNLISLDALKSSLRTVRKQNESPENLSEETYIHKRVADAGGHRQMFRKMEASLFAQNMSHGRCSGNSLDACEEKIQSRRYFERMVEICYRDNIELIVYFSPVHARYLEALNIMGKQLKVEGMKRYVVQVVADKAKKYADSAFKVWDFSGYNMITTESVPSLGDVNSIMKWYWEGSHYTKETARLVFLRIRGDDKSKRNNNFGVQLNTKNIEKYLHDVQSKRLEYMESHLQDIREMKNMFHIIQSNVDNHG